MSLIANNVLKKWGNTVQPEEWSLCNLMMQVLSENDSRVYFLIVLTTDYCWHSWACRIAAPYKYRVDWFIKPLYCSQPYYTTARFRPPSSHMVSAQPFPDRPRPMLCKSAQTGSCRITFLWLWPVTDHEPHSWHVPTDRIQRRTETTPLSGWWRSHMAAINNDHGTREMKMTRFTVISKRSEAYHWN